MDDILKELEELANTAQWRMESSIEFAQSELKSGTGLHMSKNFQTAIYEEGYLNGLQAAINRIRKQKLSQDS